MNKKGQLGPVFIIMFGLALLLIISVGLLIGGSVIKIATDEIIPEINNIGEVSEGVNISEHSEMVLTPIQSVIDSFGLLISVIMVFSLLGFVALSFVFRESTSNWVLPVYGLSVLLLIVVCIFISNGYEEFYLANDDIGAELRDASLASYFVIYSPVIMTVVAFLCGIILFTGNREEFV
jgi:hypothetical protein